MARLTSSTSPFRSGFRGIDNSVLELGWTWHGYETPEAPTRGLAPGLRPSWLVLWGRPLPTRLISLDSVFLHCSFDEEKGDYCDLRGPAVFTRIGLLSAIIIVKFLPSEVALVRSGSPCVSHKSPPVVRTLDQSQGAWVPG